MGKKRVIIIGSYIFSLVNFRRNLLEDLVQKNYEILALAPGFDKETVDTLNTMGITFTSIHLSRTGINPITDIRTILQLAQIFNSYRPDVLITYTIKPVVYGNLVASFFKSIQGLSLITGLGYLDTDVGSFKKKAIKTIIHALYRFSLRNTSFVAFQNPDDQDYFRLYKLLGTRTRTIVTAGSGVDLHQYPKAEPVSNPVLFLFTARLIKAKGIAQYLEAASNLKVVYGHRAVFRIIGLPDSDNLDSFDPKVLQQYIDKGIVEYLGHQKDVRPFLASSSVFVLPSYYREGTPRTILEALAMGKPIITTDSPGCRETVLHEKNGFLIPIKDVEALTNAMRYFIERPETIRQMGEASYQLAKQKFDVRLVNDSLFSLASL
jgi:glycosyltransferase involved in cell wall biosynthesis